MAEDSELLTTLEVADLLGTNRRTVHRWVSTGRLTAERKLPGSTGAYLFRRDVVEAAAAQPATYQRKAHQRR